MKICVPQIWQFSATFSCWRPSLDAVKLFFLTVRYYTIRTVGNVFACTCILHASTCTYIIHGGKWNIS